MSKQQNGPVERYQREVGSRTTALPAGMVSQPVRWADRPHAFSVRADHLEIPLPTRSALPHDRFAALATILRGAAALVGRRLQINWNCSAEEVMSPIPRYRRAAASGGGLYPIDIYVVARGIQNLPDGLWHYCEGHGSLAMLRAGTYNGLVAAACGDDPDQSGLYLVLSAQYWRNTFKYQQFGYHVINFDHGAMLGALDQTARTADARISVRHFFDDAMLSGLLNVDPEHEAVLSVVTVSFADADTSARPPHPRAHQGVTQPIATPLQRSRLVEVPSLMRILHDETCLTSSAPPSLSSHASAIAEPDMDASTPPGSPAEHRTRGSVYGQFDPSQATPLDVFERVLLRSRVGYDSDVGPCQDGLEFTRLMAIVLRVDRLEPGVYSTDRNGRLGQRCADVPQLATLQSLYYLQNQNVAGCSAIIVVVGRSELARSRYGARSIRVMNAEAGLVAQRLYGATAEGGSGGSAALGYNAVEIDRICGLSGGPDNALLLYFMGSILPDAGFSFQF